jgi:hypothetical protein
MRAGSRSRRVASAPTGTGNASASHIFRLPISAIDANTLRMQTAPPTPAEKLTEFSLRLSQAVEDDAAGWWLPAWLVAMIVAFVNEIVETLAHLAELLRQGKLPLPQAAQPQGRCRPAATPKIRTRKSPRPKQPMPAAAQVQVPLAHPEAVEPPATAPASAQRAPRFPWMPVAARPSQPPRRIPIMLACGPPIRFSAFAKHLPRHALIVTVSKQ